MRRGERARISLFFIFLAGAMAEVSEIMTGEDIYDASEVTWAHAVNSRRDLEQQLAGPVEFLEADITLGHTTGNEVGPPEPIMAHPPKVMSDISLDRWLDIVISRKNNKGIKLDFKSIDIVEPSLKILESHKGKLNFPLWLNADILSGPVNSPTTPVPASEFLELCHTYFPNATLSLGWTTSWFSTFLPSVSLYGWKHIRAMADILECFKSPSFQKLTFPVRAIFASRSISKLQWLLEKFPKSTLTVWSGKYDELDMKDIKRIRQSFPKSRVFYDIPESYAKQFRMEKDDILMLPPKQPTFFDHNWIKVSKTTGNIPLTCSSNTYVTDSAVMFGKGQETAVLLKKNFEITEDKPLKARGVVSFFGSGSHEMTNQTGQVIISIAQVKAFSKNVTADGILNTEDDTGIIWTVLNSSQLHVFCCNCSKDESSCHFFHLDTSAKQTFSAWSVPCDQVDSVTSAVPNSSTSEVSARKILVLPNGPLIFGIKFTGEGYAAVHDLEITDENSLTSKAWATYSASLIQIIWTILLAVLQISLTAIL